MSQGQGMGAAMGEADVTFRHLLRGIPRPILRLAFPHRALEPAGPLDPSVDRPRQRTTDNLFRVRDGNAEAAVHVEIERAWRADIARRLFEYASAAMTATRMPVWSVVVLLRPGGQPPRSTGVYRIPGARGDAVVYRYQVVPLWRLDARRMRAELGLQGAPFCVAMRGADEAFVEALASEVQNDRRLPRRDRQTTMQLLYVVSAAILGSDTARRIFHVESIIQDPNVQELIHEWEDKGRIEGERKALQTLLRTRGLSATAEERAVIEGCTDSKKLEQWIVRAVSAESVGEVLGTNRKPRTARPRIKQHAGK